jgi:hypothetical protein
VIAAVSCIIQYTGRMGVQMPSSNISLTAVSHQQSCALAQLFIHLQRARHNMHLILCLQVYKVYTAVA